jgi:uncharacterized protein YhjY with autotransporter beta-barrel domain
MYLADGRTDMEVTWACGSKRLFGWASRLWFCLLILLLVNPTVQAQVLDQKVNSLLANNCAGLLQGAGSGVLAPTLAAACTSNGGVNLTGSGTSGGGGAASVQASAISILNSTLLRRLEDVRGEGGQQSGSTAAMMMNPFGLLAPGLFRGMSMASPMSGAGDGGSAAFNLGNQQRWRGLGFFASGLVEALNRDVTTFQDGYKSTILGITAGVDYRFTRQLVAGTAISYSNTHGDFTNGGDFNTNTLGLTLFGTYLPTDRTFVQVTGGYNRNNYLVSRAAQAFIPGIAGGPDRNLSGLPSSNSNGDVFSVHALAGYDHPVGMFTVGPRLGINYTNTHITDFSETSGGGLGLRYDDQWVNSLQSVVGVLAQAAFSTGIGVLVPQVNADYIHEFANSQRFITASFVEDLRANPTRFTFQNDIPVRNFFNVGTGLIMVLPNGWQPFVNFRAMVGNEQFNNYAGTFGLRIEL